MPATDPGIALPTRYRVLRRIASGGMATVWSAEDTVLGRVVAVKVLAEQFALDEAARTRFLREARAGARLSDHPHVVTVYDLGEHDGRAFMVMEQMAGGTLAARLGTGRVPPRRLALRWLAEGAGALDHAHALDIVHRDVKPANLLLDERNRLAVADFGIAVVAGEASVTATGLVMGTASYLAPEQATGGQATAASDRYALAVVAFELLTGERPFAAAGPAGQARAHVEQDPPPPSSIAPELPPAVDDVVARGLAKAPEDRPLTATAFVDELAAALARGGEDPAETTAVLPRTAPAAVGAGAAAAWAAQAEQTAASATPPPAPAVRTPAPGAAGSPPPRTPATGPHDAGRTRRPSRTPAIAALAALALAGGAGAAVLATGDDGAQDPASTPAARERERPRTATERTQARTTEGTATTRAPATPPPTTTPSGSDAGGDPAALNDRGYALLRGGDAAAAVPLLQRSVEGFRAQDRTGEITYAYALFNLGRALRLSGRPAEAIPFLEERLRFADQREVVERELALAREAAGRSGGDDAAGDDGAAGDDDAAGGGKGKRRGKGKGRSGG